MELSEYLKEHKGSFDENARSLYEQLTGSGMKIAFEVRESENTWSMQEDPKGGRCIVIDPGNGPFPSGLIHELLHALLAHKGFVNDINISRHFDGKESYFASSQANKEIIEINNKLGHVRMINHFLEKKIDTRAFLQDTAAESFDKIKQDLECLEKLKDAGVEDKFTTIFTFVYSIGAAKLFALYPEPTYSSKIVQRLRNLDSDLFSRIETLYDQWIALDGFDNRTFYEAIDKILMEFDITSKYIHEPNIMLDFLCNGQADLFVSIKKVDMNKDNSLPSSEHDDHVQSG